jgi:carboxypeptidase-like protein
VRKGRHLVALAILNSLSGCIETTTYVSPAASGTVIDATTKKPIQGATISVGDHPGLFAQTNSDGQFTLMPTTRMTLIFWLAPYRSLPPGGTIVVFADGYASREIVVNGAEQLLVSLVRAR